MIYGKKEATMTQGLAIITMVCLHLFCRLGDKIFGTPLLWLNSEKPFVYWIGFFCEICVPIYSMCSGYAQHLLFQKGQTTYKNNLKRIFKLLFNYWIILIIFCSLGLALGRDSIPGNVRIFLGNIIPIPSLKYFPSWWYLTAYIIVLLIPAKLLMKPVNKIHSYIGVAICFVFVLYQYLQTKFSILSLEAFLPNNIYNLFNDLLKLLPFYLIGAFMHKENVFEKANLFLGRLNKPRLTNALLLISAAVLFVVSNLLEKAILTGPIAIAIMLIFNLVKKPKFVENIFLFFGKHSTNIWLTHMAFYVTLFPGLVLKARYPVLIFAFLIALCLVMSYIEMYIQKGLEFCFALVKKKRRKQSVPQ
ncbi:MAG: acyltransferase [Clostridia bacterium]|nr:acyltransferase [Clostridia bacterium]